MGVIQDIVMMLEAGGHGTFGTTIFVSTFVDAAPAAAVMVKVYGGSPDDLIGYEYPKFQVQVRNPSQLAAQTEIEAIRATLTKLNTTVNDTRWLRCRALHPPGQLGQEVVKEIPLWKTYCDFEVMKKL